MKLTDAPKKHAVPFGINGLREDILPTTPSGDNRASFDVGFPPITMTLKSAGGLPPKGQDMNQILHELSNLSRWSSAGALNKFDGAFSTAIGGYPLSSILSSDDGAAIFISTTENNTSNPNSNPSTGWLNLSKVMSIAGLAGGANKLPYFNGTSTAAQTDLSVIGRDIISKQSISDVFTYLGLGTAAKASLVGDGTSVPTTGSFSLGVTGAFKMPTGIIVQWDSGATSSGGFTKNFPTAFGVQCLALIPAIYSGLGSAYSVVANTSSRFQANINVVNSQGNGVSGITVGYIAIGF